MTSTPPLHVLGTSSSQVPEQNPGLPVPTHFGRKSVGTLVRVCFSTWQSTSHWRACRVPRLPRYNEEEWRCVLMAAPSNVHDRQLLPSLHGVPMFQMLCALLWTTGCGGGCLFCLSSGYTMASSRVVRIPGHTGRKEDLRGCNGGSGKQKGEGGGERSTYL
ncbi:hypothetical protein B0T13DRAFT_123101 [Neurospora crassa]|nr:hypothetical protein B0T13DRAFT_123101 [Neurospora crassa]